MRTRAPRSASRRATSRPTPSVDPVTSTVLFSMFMLPKTAKIWFGFGHESRDHPALSCSRILRSGIKPRPCRAATRTRGSSLPGCDAWAMARHASRAAYAIDVSACFPTHIVGLIFGWLMLNRDGLSILLHPGTGDAYADHIDHAVWLGSVLPLRTNVLRKSRKAPHIPERLRCP